MTDAVRLSLDVLLVEDDPGDVLMTQEVFADHAAANRLTVVGNGEDAIAYLHKRDRFADVSTPDLVLLDLNLPRRNGREVLRDVKADPDLRRVPVVVLTTSDSDEDVRAAYDLRANAYVRKPADFLEFASAIRAIDEFYRGVAQLPPR